MNPASAETLALVRTGFENSACTNLPIGVARNEDLDIPNSGVDMYWGYFEDQPDKLENMVRTTHPNMPLWANNIILYDPVLKVSIVRYCQ
jgi:hypothetical protein